MSLRFGLVGTGLAGPLFGGALAALSPRADFVAVSSRRRGRAEAFAAQYGVPRIYDTWQELVEAPDVDVICIATPTGTHRDIALAAAAGGKHVLTEKPIATSLADADAMIDACNAAGVQLGVIFMYRFMDTALKLKSAVDLGLIGQPVFGECIGKFWRDQPYYDSGDWRGTWEGEGGGSLMTQTSHTLDLMLWCMGEVTDVSGFYTVTANHTIATEDLVVGTLRFASGALGTVVSSSGIQPPQPRSVTIHGTGGTVQLVSDRLSQWDVVGDPDPDALRMLSETEPDRGATAGRAGYADSELHRRQIADFIDAVEQGRPPSIDGWAGRQTLEVMRALYVSSDRHQLIHLPLQEDGVQA